MKFSAFMHALSKRQKGVLALACAHLIVAFVFLVYLCMSVQTIFFNIFFTLMLLLILLDIPFYFTSSHKALGFAGLLGGAICFFVTMLATVFIGRSATAAFTGNIAGYICFFLLLLYPVFFSLIEAEVIKIPAVTIGIQWKWCAFIATAAAFVFGIVFTVETFYTDLVSTFAWLFVPSIYFFAFIFAYAGAAFVFMLPLVLKSKKTKWLGAVAGLVTASMFFSMALPLFSVQNDVNNAKIAYESVFGELAQNESFRTLPFSLGEAFLAVRSDAYEAHFDVPFYKGTSEKDQLELSFDYYTPPNPSGKYPVLLRMFGGGWVTGSKGVGNNPQYNKYFASKGYIVFDIEYGLHSSSLTNDTYGNFSVEEMMGHLGAFTKHLIQNADSYHADLTNVFTQGGSAGGQLCMSLGLGIASGKYKELFGEGITVKGMLPSYPAIYDEYSFINDSVPKGDYTPMPELLTPYPLINDKSPSCLIYIGKWDSLMDTADFIQKTYSDVGAKCAVLKFGASHHSADINFYGNNQIYLYYAERFMASLIS